MQSACSFALVILLSQATSSPTAPAPLPKLERSRSGEVIFAAETAERAQLAVLYLKSEQFHARLLAQKKHEVPIAAHDNAQAQRRWLADRMTVALQGDLVVVRVSASVPGRTREILEAMVDLLGEKPVADTSDAQQKESRRERTVALKIEYAQRVRGLHRLAEMRGGGVNPKDLEAAVIELARHTFDATPLKLHQPPRLFR